ncbi:PEP-CTERM sorting domain-containing protein [Massilia sp. TN1-12]|uniref:PEP-CTERM sorting domain-containing protein n=1 Tax=Massilia paldalensis TaxID=3377675 RepID=UPI00384F7DF7
MTKHLLAMVVGALFSLNASAGYIEYTFTGGLTGKFIQNDIDKSIADFDFYVGSPSTRREHFFGSGGYAGLSGAGSSFWGEMGPTGFSAFNRLTGGYIDSIWIDFGGSYSPTPSNYSALLTKSIDPGYPSWAEPLHPSQTWISGSVVATALTPEQAKIYDELAYPPGIYHIVPVQNVPEPTSIALVAIGALGFAGLRRRKPRN